jgi:hypothetical protein
MRIDDVLDSFTPAVLTLTEVINIEKDINMLLEQAVKAPKMGV